MQTILTLLTMHADHGDHAYIYHFDHADHNLPKPYIKVEELKAVLVLGPNSQKLKINLSKT